MTDTNLKSGNQLSFEESEFKGHPVLIVKTSENDRFGFSFGVKKAIIIHDIATNPDHLQVLMNFILKHEPTFGQDKA